MSDRGSCGYMGVYFIGDGGSNIWDSDVWSYSSGGSIAAGLRPTTTDTAIFDANSGLACTVSAAGGVCDDLDLSDWGAGTITIAAGAALTFHGTLSQTSGTFIKGAGGTSILEVDGGTIPQVSGARFGGSGTTLCVSIINGGSVDLVGDSGYARVTIDATSELLLASSGVTLHGLGIDNDGTCSGKLSEIAGGIAVIGDGDFSGLTVWGVSFNGTTQLGAWDNKGNIATCESAATCTVSGAGKATLGYGPFHSLQAGGEVESTLAGVIDIISVGGSATISSAVISAMTISGLGVVVMTNCTIDSVTWDIGAIPEERVQHFNNVNIDTFDISGTSPYSAVVIFDEAA